MNKRRIKLFAALACLLLCFCGCSCKASKDLIYNNWGIEIAAGEK